MDLYTFGTPNGFKVSIALEELGLPYHVKKIDISKGDQFKPEFLEINPNGKIPALVDGTHKIFESVAILIYLAEKTGQLIPKDLDGRMACLSWCLFQAASVGPMFGQMAHFKIYAPDKIPYAIERYSKEAQRILGVMEKQLGENRYLAGNEYSIADIATWPWINAYRTRLGGEMPESTFRNLIRWFEEIGNRPAVQRGLKVPADDK